MFFRAHPPGVPATATIATAIVAATLNRWHQWFPAHEISIMGYSNCLSLDDFDQLQDPIFLVQNLDCLSTEFFSSPPFIKCTGDRKP